MKIVMFYHSLLSDWNHGNAHFLRGVATELLVRGHEVSVYEPRNSWSLANLLAEYGGAAVDGMRAAYPLLESTRYDPETLVLERVLDGADLVIAHEWNEHGLVRLLGEYRKRAGSFRLLFHDTHHRAVTDPAAMAAYDLSGYDGVLAFGDIIRHLYISRGWAARAWTWHEAADVRIFHPVAGSEAEGDLVWVGNWGDEERTSELYEFLLGPSRELGLKTRVHGVRYPAAARELLAGAGIKYAGWLPNYEVPGIFSQFKATVHIPRRPYVRALPGIPTIRPFEALACGIPLVCSPWSDTDGLFSPGRDFLTARDGKEMRRQLRALVHDAGMRAELSRQGRRTILSRHTCGHRVDELMRIYAELEGKTTEARRHGGMDLLSPCLCVSVVERS